MTCNEFIARRRMLEARRLLDRGDLLVKEVAYRVGFGDPNYFSRRFKSFVGISPTGYCRSDREGGFRAPGENA
jgi:two-component system response regulator YesN